MDLSLVWAAFYDFTANHPGWSLVIAVIFFALAVFYLFGPRNRLLGFPIFLPLSVWAIAAFYCGIRANLGEPDRFLPDGEFLLVSVDADSISGRAYVLVRTKIVEKGSGGKRFFFGEPHLFVLELGRGSEKEKELRARFLRMKQGKGTVLKFKRKWGDPYAPPEELIMQDFVPPELDPK